jgi:hypothetical protein
MSGERGREARSTIERLVPDVFGGDYGSPAMSTFLRGVTTGALVGAAIAGSALWTRYRRQRQEARIDDATQAGSAADDEGG